VHNNLKLVTLLLGLIIIFSCEKSEDAVVALIDDYEITLKDFRVAYLEVIKKPDKSDNRELREAFLDELIHRHLLAEKARDAQMDQDEKFRYKKNAFRNKCLRDAHYQVVIKPNVAYEEDLVREVFIYSKEQRKIKHVYFENFSDAERAYEYLNNGGDFYILAKSVYRDSALSESGGDLGWVFWDQMEFDMAMIAFRLKPGNYSEPVKSSYGYHILKLENYRINPLITEDDYYRHIQDTRNMVETRLGEKIAYEYVDKMMESVNIKVNPPMLKLVGERLADVFQREPSKLDGMSMMQLNPDEQRKIEDVIWEWRNEEILYLDGEAMTMGEFISNLVYVPYAEIRRSYKTALNFIARDAQLTREAIELGLDESSEEVKRKTRIFENYLLQIAMRRQIISLVSVSDNEIEARYKELTAGKNIPEQDWRQFADELRPGIERMKKSRAVGEYLAKLKKSVHIEKNLQPIHEYYDQFSFNARADSTTKTVIP
jgi:peptidyl-prolyl cis-trans isomerase C